MLLDHKHDCNRVLLGYQFHFGVGTSSDTEIRDCNDEHPCALKDIGKCCYRSAKSKISLCSEPHRQIEETQDVMDKFTLAYKKNTDRRIRRIYKTVRDALTVKLDDMSITQLCIDKHKVNFQTTDEVTLSGLVSVQILGVCTISLWFEGYYPQNETVWRNMCDPALIQVTLAHSSLSKTTWKLLDLVRYISLKCHKTLNSEIKLPANLEFENFLQDDLLFREYLEYEYRKCSKAPISYTIESYPLFCLQYNLDANALNSIFSNPAGVKDARLVLNGDSHWRLKTDDVIMRTVNKIDITTRNSIHWLVTSQGTLKVLSKEIDAETSFEESFTAALLESDIVLTMRYFLSAIMQSLSDLSKEMGDPLKVSEMKDQMFISMDKFFNINISHNDQTIRRMEQFKVIFHIADTYANVKDRLEILSVKTSNENSAVIEKQQIFLTIIFGLFGSLQVLYPFFQELFRRLQLADWIIFLIAIITSGIIAGVIFIVVKRMKLYINK